MLRARYIEITRRRWYDVGFLLIISLATGFIRLAAITAGNICATPYILNVSLHVLCSLALTLAVYLLVNEFTHRHHQAFISAAVLASMNALIFLHPQQESISCSYALLLFSLYLLLKAMDSRSFRTIYSEILGKFRNCQSLVVDERHNGGGWLHDDLAILLSGKQFQVYNSRGQKLGVDPFNRWNRPSCVMVCEDCYSNANGFPSMYKALGLGKLVGMPMAGTMTAVWWERQEDPSLILGLPEVNCLDMSGKPLENKQLDPDVEINNTPSQMLSGDDEQLRRAIDLMMQNN